jgi:tRNA 5-methylaminomethyl-2-thiouridine biosynthesis bifunctional protein
MATPALRPARIDFSGGTPRSLDYGDVYHPVEGAQAQARHVFLQGNGLPRRWQGQRHFAVLETGFGLGHNFLATWAAWRADPQRCRHLHFVSLEQHPPTLEDLARAHGHPAPGDLAQALIAAWPPLLQGLHVREVQTDDAGTVSLTLAMGDARALLPQLIGRFDAFFLDGFAPSVNPALWDTRLLRALGRLAAPGATAATWSVARPVRDGLCSAGFEVSKAPGLGAKREMTVAHFRPRSAPRTPPGRPHGPWTGEREVVIIGAGLAGACAAQALASLGWVCTVLEAAHAPAQGASGNPAGLFHGVLHRADGIHARLHRHAALHAARYYAEHIRSGEIPGDVAGLLAVRAPDSSHAHGAPWSPSEALAGYAQALSLQEASLRTGAALNGPALEFTQGGWVDPRAVVRHALATPGVRFQPGAQVHALQASQGDEPSWTVLDAGGTPLAQAPWVVLAAGVGLPALAAPLNPDGAEGAGLGPMEAQRGQITWFASERALKRPVTGHGYAISLPDGRLLCGARLRSQDEDESLRQEDHRWNLDRLSVLTGLRPAEGARVDGRTSSRLQTPDRLPLIGPVPLTPPAAGGRQDQVRFIPRHPGLWVTGALGSRGLIWAPLAAQMLTAWVEGTPMPLQADLVDALDPARWLVRQARQSSRDES